MIITHSHELIEDQTLYLHEHASHSCTIRRCTLIVTGEGRIVLVDSDVEHTRFVFDGPAAQTISILRGIYHGFVMGSGHSVVTDVIRIIQTPLTSGGEQTQGGYSDQP